MVSLFLEYGEYMLFLPGEESTQVSDFFLVLALVEHLLISIFDLGLIQLMRWEEVKDWLADHLELELQELFAIDRLSSQIYLFLPAVQVYATNIAGEVGF